MIDRYVTTLPPGQRVASTIWTFLGLARVHQCTSWIVPASGTPSATAITSRLLEQFRVRALPGNPVVVADFGASEAIQTGRYLVRQQDLPMVQIYQCDLSMTRLCVRQLSAGETNGRYGVQAVTR